METGAAKDKIIPIAGELGVATAAEIAAYSKKAASQGINKFHFYAFEENVKESVWNEVVKA